MNITEALHILRYSIDGLGNEGREYVEAADVFEAHMAAQAKMIEGYRALVESQDQRIEDLQRANGKARLMADLRQDIAEISAERPALLRPQI